MTILTKLTQKDFEEILLRYSIGKYKAHEHISYALQNTVFILNTTKGKYVLKIFEKSEADFVKFQIRITDYLYHKKVPVARIVKLKNGRNLLMYRNKLMAIQKFVGGNPAKKLNKELAGNLAKNLALMSKHLLKLKLKGIFMWSNDHEFETNTDIENIEKVNFVGYEKKLLEEIGKLDRNNLRRSVIHGDFHEMNLLTENNELRAIIDWDDAHEDYISYEIAVYLVSYFDAVSIKRSKEYIELFFKEFQRYIKLNEEEIKAVYYFMKQRLIGVIFWHQNQKKIHKNFEKRLDRSMKKLITRYVALENITLDEFMQLAERKSTSQKHHRAELKNKKNLYSVIVQD
ncbi:MAG: Homoserine kinase [uncultured bacterium]|nr:MAG: Homoserine kinase [uncultured bacterium]